MKRYKMKKACKWHGTLYIYIYIYINTTHIFIYIFND